MTGAIEERTQTSGQGRGLLSNMSHEIRTPISGVMGMAEVLLDTELSSEQRAAVRTIWKSARALLRVVDDILELSRMEDGSLRLRAEPFDLLTVLDEVCDLVAYEAGIKELDLLIDWSNDLPRDLRGDAGRLRQVLLAMLANAVKFTSTGHVLLEARGEINADTATIVLGVEDTGIGIADVDRKRIFDGFTQVDQGSSRRFGGAGLGLAIAARLAGLMGSPIEVASEPGGGSKFSLTLQLPIAGRFTARGWDIGMPLTDISVLVVEDTARSAAVTAKLLRSLGAEVDTCSDPEQALGILEAAAVADDAYDLVLIDASMPGCDPLGTVLALRSRLAQAQPLVALVAHPGHVPDLGELERGGVDVCLVRPLRPYPLPELARRIRTRTNRANGACREALLLTSVPPNPLDPPGRKIRFRKRYGAHVLLVEDNPINQLTSSAVLRRLGCEVDVAADGEQALSKVGTNRYDLVFMDCQMPVMDGFEATRRIRTELGMRTGHLSIVALTANAMEEDRKACLDAGMDDYIAKPVSEAAIAAVLEKYYGPGQEADTGLAPKILIVESDQEFVYRIKRAVLRFFPGALVLTCEDPIDGALSIASQLPGLVFLPSKIESIDVVKLRARLHNSRRYRNIKTIAICPAGNDPSETASQLDALACVSRNYEEADIYDMLERIFNDPTTRVGLAVESPSEMPEPDLPVIEHADDGVLDPRPIIRMLGTDASLIAEFIDIFLKDMPEQIEALEQSLDDGDLIEAGKRAHRIKGASVDVGGQRVHVVSLELEQSAKREDRATCMRKFSELKRELARLTDRLNSTRWDKIPS